LRGFSIPKAQLHCAFAFSSVLHRIGSEAALHRSERRDAVAGVDVQQRRARIVHQEVGPLGSVERLRILKHRVTTLGRFEDDAFRSTSEVVGVAHANTGFAQLGRPQGQELVTHGAGR
jgi:hypothetical protein